MTHLIWYDSKTECYNHGSETDLKINESLTGEDMEVLYEMEESEIYLMGKIVAQLNNARREKLMTNQVA